MYSANFIDLSWPDICHGCVVLWLPRFGISSVHATRKTFVPWISPPCPAYRPKVFIFELNI